MSPSETRSATSRDDSASAGGGGWAPPEGAAGSPFVGHGGRSEDEPVEQCCDWAEQRAAGERRDGLGDPIRLPLVRVVRARDPRLRLHARGRKSARPEPRRRPRPRRERRAGRGQSRRPRRGASSAFYTWLFWIGPTGPARPPAMCHRPERLSRRAAPWYSFTGMGSRVLDPGLAADPKRSPLRRPPPRHREGPTAEKAKEPLRSPGRPLPQGPRAVMESRFGHDFGRIRIHDDSAAAAARRGRLDARAYTISDNLVAGAGELEPERPGRRAPARPRARARRAAREGRRGRPRSPRLHGDASEREAAAAADTVLEGATRPSLSRPGGTAAVGRQEKGPAAPSTIPRERVREQLRTYLCRRAHGSGQRAS